jgi:hypothetical protein
LASLKAEIDAEACASLNRDIGVMFTMPKGGSIVAKAINQLVDG